jgi:hypothetical protein
MSRSVYVHYSPQRTEELQAILRDTILSDNQTYYSSASSQSSFDGKDFHPLRRTATLRFQHTSYTTKDHLGHTWL